MKVSIWSRLRREFERAARALAALTLAGSPLQAQPAPAAQAAPSTQPAPSTAPAAAPVRPALWRLRDDDTTIYLFGTIHALPEGLDWRTPQIEAAVAESGEMVMEIADAGDRAAGARAMRRIGFAEGLAPILERVPEDRREKLREAIDRSSLPIEAFDRMKSWAAALILASIQFQRMGLAAERGVERGLGTPWEGQGRTVNGLETTEQQLGFLDSLSPDSQRALLLSAVDDQDEAAVQFRAMLAAWTAGDVDAIAQTFNAEESMTAELRDVLLTRRNAHWADWLRTRMEQPGTVFVAVGAGHLAGPGSVQAALAERGIRVERVQ